MSNEATEIVSGNDGVVIRQFCPAASFGISYATKSQI